MGCPVTRTVEADYLVVGAGAMGMAFTDALIDHADVRVALVDRRHGVGGHWLDAYPFVRLHQSSTFYGVASTVLGGGRIQEHGPEAGLHERADQRDDLRLLRRPAGGPDARLGPGRVLPRLRLPRATAPSSRSSRVSGSRCRSAAGSSTPATSPPTSRRRRRRGSRWRDGARVIPVNDLVRSEEAPSQYVIVGSGKTATDACIWLLARGVDPDAICWVRPRDPWMLNRAVIQPDPVIYLGMVADMMRAARRRRRRWTTCSCGWRTPASCCASTARSRRPWPRRPPSACGSSTCCAPSSTSYAAGHIDTVRRGRIDLADGSVAVADDALVVNCAADGLKNPPRVPIWGPEAITLQTDQGGVPLLRGGARRLRRGDPRRRRREEPACPPSSYGNTLTDWATDERPRHAELGVVRLRARHQGVVRPGRAQPRARPAGVRPAPRSWTTSLDRLQTHLGPGLAGLARLSDV